MVKNPLLKILSAAVLLAGSSLQASAQGTIYTIAGDGYGHAANSYTTAGNGTASFTTDASAAAQAIFSNPSGVAVDAKGNVYISDVYEHQICVISPNGSAATIKGYSIAGHATMNGLAIAPGAGFADATASQASQKTLAGYLATCAYGSAIAANLNTASPTNDEGAAVVSTTELPRGIWKDKAGNLYIADHSGNKILKVDATTNAVTTITGGPKSHGFSPDGTPAASCLWGVIGGVCADNDGNIYVADRANHVVRMIDTKGIVRTIAGNGTAGYSGDGGSPLNATLNNPSFLFLNSTGNLFICDPLNSVVRVVNVLDASAGIQTLAGNGAQGYSGDGGAANKATLNNPSSVWQDANGVIYIADMGNMRIRSVLGTGLAKETTSVINLYPNPTNGSFKVLTNAIPGSSMLEVVNVLGEQVYSEKLAAQETVVNLNVPAGVYNVVLHTGGTTTYQKIIIGK